LLTKQSEEKKCNLEIIVNHLKKKLSTIVPLLCLFLSSSIIAQEDVAQDSLTRYDDTSIVARLQQAIHLADSLKSVDEAYSSIIIPSYEELLENYYTSMVKVDKRLYHNPYRFHIHIRSIVNPYIYEDIVLVMDSQVNLVDYTNLLLEDRVTNTIYTRDEQDVYRSVLTYIAVSNPALVSTTFDMMPTAPDEENLSIIQAGKLDFTLIEKKRGRIRRPERIEKQKYGYNPWDIKVISKLNLNQVTFTNWAKGGENSLSLSGRLSSSLDYVSFDKRRLWDNDIDLRLGFTQTKGEPFEKNQDLFKINSKFALKAENKWFYAANAELRSQFTDGYKSGEEGTGTPISAFFSPVYFNLSVGMDYKYGTKKNKKLFSVLTSPLAFKITAVTDTATINQTRFGIDKDKRSRQEIGGSVEFLFEYAYEDIYNVKSRMRFFSNYQENPENVDFNWTTSMTYHLNRLFAISFSFDVIYDDDVDILLGTEEDGTKIYGQRLQFREFIGFGITYRIM
jgi:hypothetical protein